MLAEMGGSIQVGLAGLGSAIGVGLVGMKASEAVGRNPGAFGKIIDDRSLLGMAFAEAIVFYALFLVDTNNLIGAEPCAPRQPFYSIYDTFDFFRQHRQRPGAKRPATRRKLSAWTGRISSRKCISFCIVAAAL